MKKTHLLILCLFTLSAVSSAQNGWTAKDRREFVTSCIGTAKAGMSVDSARHYCICMLEKVEAKYPVATDAAKITGADFETPEWKKMIQGCLTGQWKTDERSEFITSCVDAAKAALGESKAKSYCECMLYKVEKAYPNAEDAGKLTAEVLAQPAWKKKLQDCLANAE